MVAKMNKKLIKYEEMWVALSIVNNEIIAAAKSVAELYKKLAKLKTKDINIMYVPSLSKYYSPYADQV